MTCLGNLNWDLSTPQNSSYISPTQLIFLISNDFRYVLPSLQTSTTKRTLRCGFGFLGFFFFLISYFNKINSTKKNCYIYLPTDVLTYLTYLHLCPFAFF